MLQIIDAYKIVPMQIPCLFVKQIVLLPVFSMGFLSILQRHQQCHNSALYIVMYFFKRSQIRLSCIFLGEIPLSGIPGVCGPRGRLPLAAGPPRTLGGLTRRGAGACGPGIGHISLQTADMTRRRGGRWTVIGRGRGEIFQNLRSMFLSGFCFSGRLGTAPAPSPTTGALSRGRATPVGAPGGSRSPGEAPRAPR